jgi:flavin reductase (DIM6/NTAB) family NADH-FMN oxidoreductase RutF
MIPDWSPGTPAFLATAAADGPHSIPVSTALRADPTTVLFALGPSRGSLARLRDDPRCALAIVAAGLAVTLRGRATVVGDAAGTVAVRLDVEAVDDHGQPTFAIDEGVRWHWTDGDAEAGDAAVRARLREL